MQTNPNTLAISVTTVLVLIFTKRPIESTSCQIFTWILPHKKFPPESEGRRQKADMLGERIFRFIIYVASISLLYKILLQEDCSFLSIYLGGSATDPKYYANYPCINKPSYLEDLYVFKLTYHLYELIFCLALQRKRRDFPEYILHHLMTWALIFFSYTMNLSSQGAVTMLVHDLSDLAVTLFKLTVDITPVYVEMTFYAAMVTSWVYLRLWFFPVHIIYQYYLETLVITN